MKIKIALILLRYSWFFCWASTALFLIFELLSDIYGLPVVDWKQILLISLYLHIFHYSFWQNGKLLKDWIKG